MRPLGVQNGCSDQEAWLTRKRKKGQEETTSKREGYRRSKLGREEREAKRASRPKAVKGGVKRGEIEGKLRAV